MKELFQLLGRRMTELRARYGDNDAAIAPVRDGIKLGFELAALAARARGLNTFAIEIEQSAEMLKITRSPA